MNDFRFFHPIEVRYGDLDPQGHVNNAKYVTYFETARVQYVKHLGLFSENRSFLELGVILADLQISYLAPIQWGMTVQVGVRTTKLGNKSLEMAQCVSSSEDDTVYATGTIVLVAFDYQIGKSVPVPEDWRQKISEFEGF